MISLGWVRRVYSFAKPTRQALDAHLNLIANFAINRELRPERIADVPIFMLRQLFRENRRPRASGHVNYDFRYGHIFRTQRLGALTFGGNSAFAKHRKSSTGNLAKRDKPGARRVNHI